MAGAKDILLYLRECYRENGSRGGIWNFFGSAVQNRVFLSGRDFLAEDPEGESSHYLRKKAAGTAAEKAYVYRKEKDLVYATVFLTGWVERFEGKPEVVCAPLFLFPASLETEGLEFGARLEIDPGRRQINYPVIEALGGEELVKAVEEAVEPEALTEGCVGAIRRLFRDRLEEADTEALLQYPGLRPQKELLGIFEAVKADRSAGLVLTPAAAIGLVKKSTEMRGVLNELEEMAASGSTLSPSVAALLGEPVADAKPALAGRVPAVLSGAQQRILESARRHPLTLAIGPPGTGKSFTIAALAIEAVSRGGSVLIASKMDHAVDVVGNKIEKAIGLDGVVVRGGRREYLRELKRFLGELLDGIHTADAPDDPELRAQERALGKLDKQIGRLKRYLSRRLRKEIGRGSLLSETDPGFFTRLRQQWARRSARRAFPAWELAARLESLIDTRLEETVKFLKGVRKNLLAGRLRGDGRKNFQVFLSGLRARTGSRQEKLFGNTRFDHLLGALPVWLVNLSDVHRILPLTEGVFDLAIIDEATQCDMASALPVLQRARRAVITGDPRQLRHLSFLPRIRQRALADQHGLDAGQRESFGFRDVSLLDLGSEQIHQQERVAFLNEHFRSEPEIIEFSNREFYSGRLHVMTGLRRSARRFRPPVQINRVDGCRADSGANPAEAAALIGVVLETAAAELSVPADLLHSIGILSPFRDQVECLRELLLRAENGRELMVRHDILIGTSHTFQGEERDLMFLSLAVDDDSPAASFRFLEKADVFNVAITRARLLNRVWHSFDPGLLKPESLLAGYFAHAAGLGGERAEDFGDTPEKRIHDQFAGEVAAELELRGAQVSIGYPLAGMHVDLIYSIDGIARGIDLIGFPGAFSDAFPLERVLTFRRAGLQILPIPFSAWHCRREETLDWLTGGALPGKGIPSGIDGAREIR